jgi:hypothetical protein
MIEGVTYERVREHLGELQLTTVLTDLELYWVS